MNHGDHHGHHIMPASGTTAADGGDYDYVNGPAPNTTVRPMPNTPGGNVHDHAGHMGAVSSPIPSSHRDHAGLLVSPDEHSGHEGHMTGGDTAPRGGHNHGAVEGGMEMFFHAGVTETILFSFWKINTVGGLIGSCIGLFIMAVLYEGLKVFREWLQERTACATYRRRRAARSNSTGEIGALAAPSGSATLPINGDNSTPLNPEGSGTGSEEVDVRTEFRPSPLSVGHLLQSALHVVQVALSYLLMLVVMTYNVYLCLAVVLGAGVGHFLFGWRRRVLIDVNEHCH